MAVGNNLPLIGTWLIRGVLMSVVLLTVVGTACRQAPNLFLLGSTNNVRVTDKQAAVAWAEPVQVQGLPNLHKVSDGLYRGAQPTAEGLPELKKLGVRTVVNLRETNGDQAQLAELGVAYEHIPMSALHPKDDDVVRFLRIAGDQGSTPIFVHCQRGADRTGLMCAVYRIAVQGWTKDDAIAEMSQGGFRFNRGFQNIINYIRDLDVDQIKQRVSLTSAVSLN